MWRRKESKTKGVRKGAEDNRGEESVGKERRERGWMRAKMGRRGDRVEGRELAILSCFNGEGTKVQN